ncbi:MAG: DUF1616 domain-containing protein [Candidatus Natronoplasma sp.]
MKIVIKEKPWDLVIVAVFTTFLLLAIVLIPESVIRTVLGLPFLLFFPGYVLISAMFPEVEPLDKIERIALSFGLSIAITPLIGLTLNYTWEISFVPIIYSQSLFIYTFSLLAYLRRISIPKEEMFSIEFEINPPDWDNYDWIDKALVIATVVFLIASSGLAYHIATTPRTGERFTEFGVLGETGMADDYPTNLTVDENGTFSVMVTNREHETVNYTLAIGLGHDFEEMENEGEISEDYDLIFPSNNTYKELPLILDHEERWNQTMQYRVQTPGHYRLSFFLIRDGEIYRNIHLWIEIKEG